MEGLGRLLCGCYIAVLVGVVGLSRIIHGGGFMMRLQRWFMRGFVWIRVGMGDGRDVIRSGFALHIAWRLDMG